MPDQHGEQQHRAADDRDRDRVPAVQALPHLHDEGEEREAEQHADGEVGEAGRGRAHEREQEERGDRRDHDGQDRDRFDRHDEAAGGVVACLVMPVGRIAAAGVGHVVTVRSDASRDAVPRDRRRDRRPFGRPGVRARRVRRARRGVIVAARRPLGWAVATVIAASFLAPAVERLAEHVRRVVALIIVLLLTAATIGLVMWGVLHDLDRESKHLYEVAPIAARSIERSPRFGKAARDFKLEQRVTDAVATLRKRSQSLAGKAASRAGTYFVCAILTIFMLNWGPRMARSAGQQFTDPVRRARRARRGRCVRSLAALRRRHGCPGAGVRRRDVVGLQRPVGSGADSARARRRVLLDRPVHGCDRGIGPRAAHHRRIGVVRTRRSAARDRRRAPARAHLGDAASDRRTQQLYVGPLVLITSITLGYRVYGTGGAVFGSALAVLGVAIVNAAGEDRKLIQVDSSVLCWN